MEEFLAAGRTTDGWRALFAAEFTVTNVRRLSWAITRYLLDVGGKHVLIGYDTRFMGGFFAREIASVVSACGIACDLVVSPVPTPVVSWYTRHNGYDLGLTVTASHNPYTYNGIKIRMSDGGPPDKQVMTAIEAHVPREVPSLPTASTAITMVNPLPAYIAAIRTLTQLEVIDAAALNVAVDSMHGTTAHLLKQILAGTRTRVVQVRGRPDPLFGGVPPEPKATSLGPLQAAMKRRGCVLGVAHDGDGDRIVALDPDAGYLSPHDLAVLLALDLHESKQMQGAIVGSSSSSRRLSQVATALTLPYREVPTGFRHACNIMRTEPVLIAAEENGGIGFGFHLPDRDGTLAAVLLVEMIARRQTGLGAIKASLVARLGHSSLVRRDVQVSVPPQKAVTAFGQALSDQLDGLPVVSRATTDGLKILLLGGSWVMIRASGTEPVLRIYAEHDDTAASQALIRSVINTIERAGIVVSSA